MTQKARYSYCRRRVEFLLGQPLSNPYELIEAFETVYKTLKEQKQAADQAEAIMRKVEDNIRKNKNG